MGVLKSSESHLIVAKSVNKFRAAGATGARRWINTIVASLAHYLILQDRARRWRGPQVVLCLHKSAKSMSQLAPAFGNPMLRSDHGVTRNRMPPPLKEA
jgi:hypothetical protein